MDGQIQRLDVPHLNPAQCLTQPYAVAGVTEHEEGNQDKHGQHYAYDRHPFAVWQVVADLPQPGRELPLGVCHTLLYTVSLAARKPEIILIIVWW